MALRGELEELRVPGEQLSEADRQAMAAYVARQRERRLASGLPPLPREEVEEWFLGNLAEQRSAARRVFRTGGRAWRARSPDQLVRTRAIDEVHAWKREEHMMALAAWSVAHGYLTPGEAEGLYRVFTELLQRQRNG